MQYSSHSNCNEYPIVTLSFLTHYYNSLHLKLAPVALAALGFTSGGIAAGSIAAKLMVYFAVANGGGVAAESLVAIAQSLGKLDILLISFYVNNRLSPVSQYKYVEKVG